MKKVVFLHFLPVLICVVGIVFFYKDIDKHLFKSVNLPKIDKTFHHIGNFSDYPGYEDIFLSTGDSAENIWMLGSSELGINTEATPYNFINNNFKTHLNAVGHAGNQSLSIYSALFANASKLDKTPIVILVSPGWFHSKSTVGTSSQVFLEFNPPSFFDKIAFNDTDIEFRQYEAKRLAELFNEFSNPSLAMKAMYFEHSSDRNIISSFFSYPVNSYFEWMLSYKNEYFNAKTKHRISYDRQQIIAEEKSINWDSLYNISAKEQAENSSCNKWGIDNEHYRTFIKGETTTITIIDDADNRELEDFVMLVKLLKEKNANASFVIQPINPYYYKNANELNNVIWKIDTQIKLNGFPCLNLWNSDSTTFDKSLLKDVMHLSSYGWYKIDKFIVDTYKLTK